MPNTVSNITATKTTSYKAVLPFYLYAAVSFFAATLMLFFSSGSILDHYFQPHVLAITHTMTLGWGTMIILGASHQLVPVIIEGSLFSEKLAYVSFILAACGIPLLVYGFYFFNMGLPAQSGGSLIVLSIIVYVINLGLSASKTKTENVHMVFVLTAAGWLLFTTLLGLILVFNFVMPFLKADSLHYLPLHAHLGIIGWFLLLVVGVGSRLIPMFLISKYTNEKLLWWIYALINGGLIFYCVLFGLGTSTYFLFLPALLLLIAISGFIYYCYQAYKQRIRKNVDDQMKVSLISVLMIVMPIVLLLFTIVVQSALIKEKVPLVLEYGFLIFFGWLTAIILGMTFKTLPFIIWNKVYHDRSANDKTPSPKDLFSHVVFKLMSIAYLIGLVIFTCGVCMSQIMLLNGGALLLVITSFLYNFNVIKVVLHKPIAI